MNTNMPDQLHREIGFVTEANSYLLSIEGVPSAHVNDLLEDKHGNRALVASLEKDHVKALLLDDALAKSGDEFFLREEGLTYALSDHLLGRVINALGVPIDEKESLPKGGKEKLGFDVIAPGINHRESISKQFFTGVMLVDTLFPIGQGQRQLLFGPTSSGKTAFLREAIVNQKGKDVVCIYVGVGKPIPFIQHFARSIFERGAAPYSIVVAAPAEAPTPLHSIAPNVGFFIAEHFQKQGRNVFLIVDDFGAHAKYMREIALLMGNIPGRQSYPGDIFYQHAHLLERAGNFNKNSGGGSITVLPVLETDIENFTDLIPTNIMATTDGHLFFSPTLRAEGQYPSVAIDRSVTRVGRQTQRFIQQELSVRIMSLFVEYRRQQEYVQFGTNTSSKTKDIIRQGEVAKELLKQNAYQNIEPDVQLALMSLAFAPFFLNREVSYLRACKNHVIEAIRNDPQFENVRASAKTATSLNELLEQLTKNSYIFERVCQP